MKLISACIVGLGVLMAFGNGRAAAKEETIRLDALPASVRDSLDVRYPGAAIRGLTHERDSGVDLYEAELTVAGMPVDALFESTGRLREEEAVIPVAELPVAVRDALRKSAQGGWKIERIERVRTGDGSVAPKYELLVAEGGVRVELRYQADGRRLSAHKAAPGD